MSECFRGKGLGFIIYGKHSVLTAHMRTASILLNRSTTGLLRTYFSVGDEIRLVRHTLQQLCVSDLPIHFCTSLPFMPLRLMNKACLMMTCTTGH